MNGSDMSAHSGVPVIDDKSFREALAHREKLLEELRKVEDFLRLYEHLFGAKATKPSATKGSSEVATRRRARNVLPPARLAEIAREIILESGHPMTRGQLVEAMEARGIPLAGTDKSKNLGTILWRFSDRFQNIPGEGYWPSDAPRTRG